MRTRRTFADQDAAKVRHARPGQSRTAAHEVGPTSQWATLPAAQALVAATSVSGLREQGFDAARASTIQRLQRAYGNQAVQAVLQRRHHRHRGGMTALPAQQATMRVQLQDKVNTHHTVVLHADWNTGVTYADLEAALDALSDHAPNSTIRKAMQSAVQAQKTYWQAQVNPGGVPGSNDSRSEYFGERGGWRVDVENIRGVNLKR